MSFKNQPFVFLEGDAETGAQLYVHPQKIITAYKTSDVKKCLNQLQDYTDQGYYAAGFMSYECGYALEEKLDSLLSKEVGEPLLWYGIFDTCKQLTSDEANNWLQEQETGSHKISSIEPSLKASEYEKQFKAIKDFISTGDIYQANLTFKGQFEFSGCPFSLYRNLRHAQQTAYGGLIETGEQTILSLSPELFFSRHKSTLKCHPMKGTAKRGVTNSEDLKIKDWLKTDEKSRAENLMIVDLMRNDMSRISKPGSVKVEKLYNIETYTSLHQMTSEISSQLRDDVTILDLIENIYPCGSVTGAPKLRAMEIIHSLETHPRGIYTGAIGVFEPEGNAQFNVAIRTITLNDQKGEIGIGSGLVSDSCVQDEYEECLLKMKFLNTPHPVFDLLETLKWNLNEGYILLDYHLDRLEKSAQYFCFPFNRKQILKSLGDDTHHFNGKDQRVRLLLDNAGAISISHTPLESQLTNKPWSFVVSDKRTNSKNAFLYHKTTHRSFYDDERELQKEQNRCDEVIFLNEKDEITEGSFTNIFLRINGNLLTPARTCGLLNGTYRRYLLERPNDPAREAILKMDDLKNADGIYLGNSVRGLIPAQLTHNFTPA